MQKSGLPSGVACFSYSQRCASSNALSHRAAKALSLSCISSPVYTSSERRRIVDRGSTVFRPQLLDPRLLASDTRVSNSTSSFGLSIPRVPQMLWSIVQLLATVLQKKAHTPMFEFDVTTDPTVQEPNTPGSCPKKWLGASRRSRPLSASYMVVSVGVVLLFSRRLGMGSDEATLQAIPTATSCSSRSTTFIR